MSRGGCRFLALVAWYAFSLHASGRPVHVESGDLEGLRQGPLTVYKGIPFAEPPTGALRWRPPRLPANWSGVRTATAFAPACMQKGVSMPGEPPPATSEDCLYLNVWTPSVARNRRLPVMVWIHGGAYKNGSASMPLYWGDRLARRGIVVITIAYRLGPLGFLAHPELSAESAGRSSGNYGLLDQVAALQWIQRNVAAFGGDPRRVTIAGQSSGAMSVSVLMAMPRARGLFQRAIAQSGGLFEPLQLAPGYLLENAERDGMAYASSLGADSLESLRARPAEELLEGAAGKVSHPVVDHEVLPQAPYDAFVSGRFSDVPVLLGFNADEARAFGDFSSARAASFGADIERSFGRLPPELLQAYWPATDASAARARLDFERDLRFGWDMWTWARLQAGRAYFYYFAHQPPFPAESAYHGWGASHFAELWYVFDHLDQASWAWESADRRLAGLVANYWTNFVERGDPNGATLPRWPRFGAGAEVMRLDDPAAAGVLPGVDRLRAIDAVYTAVRRKPLDGR